MNTVEPPNNGHIRTSHFVLYTEVVLSYTVDTPNKGHVGTQSFVLYREVSFIRRLKCTGIIRIGTNRFVLYREVFFIQNVLYQRFHCNREGTSECVLYREVFYCALIWSVLYWRFLCMSPVQISWQVNYCKLCCICHDYRTQIIKELIYFNPLKH